MTSVELLVKGFARREGPGVWDASSNVTLVIDGDAVLLVDLGSPDRWRDIREALQQHGLVPEDVDTVLLTHLHVDHVGALSLFPHTRIIVPEGVAQGSRLQFCNPVAIRPSPGSFVLRVPGHTAGDIALGLHGDDGRTTVVAGDLFPTSIEVDAPDTALDRSLLTVSRKRVLALADMIVTGHGPILATGRTDSDSLHARETA